ncbi:MAG: hypothetical protein KGN77_01945 [Xanthomonadaceae bacterium]|nr:hypothetical protein [Xanthomonadaceae bacterium]
METNDIPSSGPTDWQPIGDKHDLAVLGKLGEEAAELAGICFRCIIQGLDEAEPRTGKVNRVALTEEIADVTAMIDAAVQRLRLSEVEISRRVVRKSIYKKPWFDSLAARSRDSDA